MGTRKMSPMTTDDPWASIDIDAIHVLGRRAGGAHALSIYWVRNSEGAPGLLVRGIDRDVVPSSLPKTRGISIQVGALETKEPEARLFLLSPGDRDVFLTLCRDVVKFSSGEGNARAATLAVFRRLDHWRALLSRARPQEMSPQEIRGLIGELCVLLHLTQSIGIASALSAWVAPEDHPQDFALASRLLEVKSRLAGSRQHVQISSLEQLESGKLPIFLLVVELAPSEADASFSLNDIVGKVLDKAVADSVGTRDRAERLLLLRGYTENDVYGADRYVVSGELAYLVEEGFPRLVRSTTDRRIHQASYVLDLTTLDAFARHWADVFV